jgi:hypothetical protein
MDRYGGHHKTAQSRGSPGPTKQSITAAASSPVQCTTINNSMQNKTKKEMNENNIITTATKCHQSINV